MQLRLSGQPEIIVEFRRNAQARRLLLRVSQLDGRVTLTLPKAASQAEAVKFVQQKEEWVRRQLGNRIENIVPQIGGAVMFEGRDVPVIAGPGRACRYESGQMIVPGRPARVPVRVAAFFKVIARQRLETTCKNYAIRLGVDAKRITLRDTRSRWGSCTSQGNLMFSWRLIMAPLDVLNYVAAHEVAHLVEMNHSAAYWSVVAKIYPDYKAPRLWLRRNGSLLHAYQFAELTPDAACDHNWAC